MCFRPAEVAMKKCPECGTPNKPIANECAKCGAPLENKKMDFDADQASLDAANTFAAPKAPGAPKPPVKPGAPKPPMA